MKATIVTGDVRLDYTDIAKPLTFKDIYDDITEVQAGFFREPHEITLWEHQWNWLVDATFVLPALRSIKTQRPRTIYGIPLRIAN